jgi:PAS domain S-box-containing protein
MIGLFGSGVITFQSVPAAIPVGLAAAVSLALAAYAWRRRFAPLGLAFAIMMTGETAWALGAAAEPLVVELPVKRLLLDFRLLGTVTGMLGLLALVFRFAGISSWLQPRRFLLVCAPALLILLAAWTDPWHHLYWARFANEEVENAWIAIRSPGPAFWAFVAYAYSLAAVATTLLTREAFRLSGIHRVQAVVMLFGVLLPWVVDILDMMNVWPFIPVDLVSISFAVTGLTFLPAVFRYRLLDLTPVAWATVVKLINDAVIVIDAQGRVATLNPAARHLIGRPDIEVLGIDAGKVFEAWSPLAALLDQSKEQKQETGLEVFCTGIEPERCYEASLSRLNDPEQSMGWVLILRDITESRRADEQRSKMNLEREARVEAEAANRAKDVFLAMLSHELRTPLTPVLATATAMLEDPTIPPSFQAALKMIRRNIDLEARLIDNLLDLTRIRRGLLTLHREIVDAHELIDRVLEICGDDVHDADLTLRSQLRASEHHLDADAIGIQQVLWNLLKNAIKFSPPGKTVLVRSYNHGGCQPGQERAWLVIEVIDQGIGIEPDLLPRIFDLFERGGPIRGRTHGGLGLGLTISKTLTERHGGRLSGFSKGPGMGSTFTLELPTVPESARVIAADEPLATPVHPGRPLRLLLVEDNVDTLRSLSDQLEKRGHAVRTASTLAGAMRVLEERGLDLDLLVSDIELPDGDGHELMAALRLQGSVPGIALSGFGTSDDIDQSLAAGFAEHLTKPFEFQVLDQCIQRVTAQTPTGQPSDS